MGCFTRTTLGDQSVIIRLHIFRGAIYFDVVATHWEMQWANHRSWPQKISLSLAEWISLYGIDMTQSYVTRDLIEHCTQLSK